MEDVTFIILTKNEEINLRDCLESIKGFAKRIVVVDCGSTDGTVDIANKFKCDVMFHPFENYAKQFNWALDNAKINTKWSFRLDADERLTPDLCDELSKIMKKHDSDDVNGVTMEAWLYFMGKKIRFGGHQKRKLMLFKTGIGRIEDRQMDEHTILSRGTSISSKNRFIHYDFKSMTQWIEKLNWYATRETMDYFDYLNGRNSSISSKDDKKISRLRGKKFKIYYKFPKFLRCWLLFIYYYIFALGFLDGRRGFVYHWMYHKWYRTLVDAKILEKQLEAKQSFAKKR